MLSIGLFALTPDLLLAPLWLLALALGVFAAREAARPGAASRACARRWASSRGGDLGEGIGAH
jgi:hypothetical protein